MQFSPTAQGYVPIRELIKHDILLIRRLKECSRSIVVHLQKDLLLIALDQE